MKIKVVQKIIAVMCAASISGSCVVTTVGAHDDSEAEKVVAGSLSAPLQNNNDSFLSAALQNNNDSFLSAPLQNDNNNNNGNNNGSFLSSLSQSEIEGLLPVDENENILLYEADPQDNNNNNNNNNNNITGVISASSGSLTNAESVDGDENLPPHLEAFLAMLPMHESVAVSVDSLIDNNGNNNNSFEVLEALPINGESVIVDADPQDNNNNNSFEVL